MLLGVRSLVVNFVDRMQTHPVLLRLQLLPKTSAASERLARLRKQGAQLAALGMTDKVAENRKQQDAQAARIQVRASLPLRSRRQSDVVQTEAPVRSHQ